MEQHFTQLLNYKQLALVCDGLNTSRMQAFVSLPTEFDNLLLNAAGFFYVSPCWQSFF